MAGCFAGRMPIRRVEVYAAGGTDHKFVVEPLIRPAVEPMSFKRILQRGIRRMEIRSRDMA